MTRHKAKYIETVADLLESREWPEPAESHDEYAAKILDALAAAGALTPPSDDLPWFWSERLNCWVTVPERDQ